MRLETFVILLIVGSLFCCTCIADKSDVDKTRKVKTCAHKCGACFTDGDLLGRMGCVEMCELGDADVFTCTVGAIPHDTSLSREKEHLRKELDELYAKKDQYWKDGNFDGIKTLYTADAMYFGDKLSPGIGIEGLLQGLKDCLDANEHIAYHVFVGDTDPYDFGENKSSGIVWDNGELRAFDDQDNLVGKFRYVIVYKRINGELKGYIEIIGF